MVKANDVEIYIKWYGPDGFGEYNIWTDMEGRIKGDSEYMDRGDKKDFLKSLFDSILEQVEIVG